MRNTQAHSTWRISVGCGVQLEETALNCYKGGGRVTFL